MGQPRRSKRFALDTNVLYALAGGENWAHAFREKFQERGFALFATPTVIEELAHAATEKEGEEQALAGVALRDLRGWGATPLPLSPVEHGIAEKVAREAIWRCKLPSDELHDALILAEASLCDLPVLVTSDRHLLDADSDAISLCLANFDLPPVNVAHPKALLRAA
ncbi:MAG: type II toxin-antitoxin system VapC family toxin [Verrucomicrobiae bacterium]|nr:type II toxin-antitoxin system VapC family toxin [Verrucomicrobiae bacterium]